MDDIICPHQNYSNRKPKLMYSILFQQVAIRRSSRYTTFGIFFFFRFITLDWQLHETESTQDLPDTKYFLNFKNIYTCYQRQKTHDEQPKILFTYHFILCKSVRNKLRRKC